MKIQIIVVAFIFSYVSLWSQNQNLSNGSVFDGEPYIAINPVNPDHIVVSWMGWAGISDRIKIKVRTSLDGGNTWGDVAEISHAVNGYTSADPSIAFHPDGSIYVSFIDSSGVGSNPLEGGVYICNSIDGGETFSSPSEVVNIDVDPDRIPVDRPWIVIDRSNGAHQGTIYVTTMNVEGALPDFHPYVSISTDNGNTFQWKELDGPGWLSGNLIERPMPTPGIGVDGVFYAIYPSFVATQNPLPQFILATSDNAGVDFSYQTVFASVGSSPDPLAKLGYLLRADPSDENHMVFLYLGDSNGDFDVFYRETFDLGITWSEAERVNDDPITNGKMQDLVWADFDLDGNLVVSWRDRRNGLSNTYETDSEIWAAYREEGATQFASNFQITNEIVAYDDILASSGNDFMGVDLNNDIIHCVWGDPRNGTLSIWYQSLNTDGTVLDVIEVASESKPLVHIYPNPVQEWIHISSNSIQEVFLYDVNGSLVAHRFNPIASENLQLAVDFLKTGVYFLEVLTDSESIFQRILKE